MSLSDYELSRDDAALMKAFIYFAFWMMVLIVVLRYTPRPRELSTLFLASGSFCLSPGLGFGLYFFPNYDPFVGLGIISLGLGCLGTGAYKARAELRREKEKVRYETENRRCRVCAVLVRLEDNFCRECGTRDPVDMRFQGGPPYATPKVP